jgi:hypothetical protein
VLTNEDNGAWNDTVATLGTLANLVSLCAPASSAGRDEFQRSSTPPGGAAPQNTVEAILNLARSTLAPEPLFALARSADVVQPALSSTPAAWTLVLLCTEPERVIASALLLSLVSGQRISAIS